MITLITEDEQDVEGNIKSFVFVDGKWHPIKQDIGDLTQERTKPKYKPGDKVTSVINPAFLGQVVSITLGERGPMYEIEYFKDGELLYTNMFGFSLEPVSDNGSLGFSKK